MTRFFALVWNGCDEHSRHRAATIRHLLANAASMRALIDLPGFVLFVPHVNTDPPARTWLAFDAGIIFGSLFKRSADADPVIDRRPMLDEHETRNILRTQGRSLIDSHFGSYVLILCDPENGRIRVFRGPAGSLPCCYATHSGVAVLFTHAEDLQWLGCGLLSINWDAIRAQSAAGDYLTRETGLTGVMALISGECLDIHGGRIIHESYWNPARGCTNPIRNFSDAATRLGAETRRCVRAWASLHERVLLLLSGGLDSSIVLSCLRTPPTHSDVVAVNFHSPGAGDERRFARSMARKNETPLEEVASNLNIDLRDFLRCARCALTPSPVLNFTAFDVEPVMRELARERHATAIFTGETGDDVFGHAPMPEALCELLTPMRIHRFLAASLDYAELTRTSVWRAMHLAASRHRWRHRGLHFSVYRHRRLAGHSRATSLISDEAADRYETMIERFVHPWFQDADALPPGKAMLIYSLIKATSPASHSPFAYTHEIPTIHPLASQPLIETSLAIPSEMHFRGAENGAVARAAFRSALSQEVLGRGAAKGAPAAWASSLLANNSAFLQELLLEGVLVDKGILDRAKTEALLSRQVGRTRVGMAELIRQVYIELWLRRWAEEGVRL